jgi:4-hydroxybenzoate polyprenyltransferase
MIVFEAIGYQAVQPDTSLSWQFVLAAVMFSALYVCATCFNDAADEEIDKINLPNDISRPLMTTNVTGRQLQALGLAVLVLAVVVSVIIRPDYLLFVLAGAILNIFYSLPPLRLSYRGIFASLWLSLSYVVVPFLAGALLRGSMTRTAWYILLAMYSFFVSRILLKDFRDYKGDKKFGKLNFLVRHGPRLTCLTSASAWLAGDFIASYSLYRTQPVLIYLTQALTLVALYALYILANEKKYNAQLAAVAIIGRMGNALALALLTALTLRAFHYASMQNNLLILLVGAFTAATALNVHSPS